MIRFMFRAQVKKYCKAGIRHALAACKDKVKSLVEAGTLMTVTLYKYKSQLYLYYECTEKEILPQQFLEALSNYLENWPGESEMRKWVPLHDIFHFDKPVDAEYWQRKLSVEKRVGRLALVKPEMLGSYIYYHYQLQEECRETGNKYCIIGLYENLIFHYEEHPVEISAPSFEGSLHTASSPKDWKKLMDPHFIPHENESGEKVNFIVMDELLSF